MLPLLNPPGHRRSRLYMGQMTPEEKEYEALSTVRDVIALLYAEICENTDTECELLLSAFEHLTFLVDKAEGKL